MMDTMSRVFRHPAIAAFLAIAMVLPAFAHAPAEARVVITHLGSAPLLPRSRGGRQLLANFRAYQPILRRAAAAIGLTPAEYQTFRRRVEASPRWVTIPRHYDNFSWADVPGVGPVHVIHDVTIPAGERGFVVDISRGAYRNGVRVVLPETCGNLSSVSIPPPPPPPHPHPPPPCVPYGTIPMPYGAVPCPTAPPTATPTPVPTCVPIGTSPAPYGAIPCPTAAPVMPPPVVPPVPHPPLRLNLLPLAALLPFLFGGSQPHVNPPPGGGTVIGPPPCP